MRFRDAQTRALWTPLVFLKVLLPLIIMGVSVVENANEFTFVNTNNRIEKGTYRRADVIRTASQSGMKCFVGGSHVQPATLSEAKDDLKYVGPTWLDKQFSHPSPVVAPDILENINVLKRERLEFLISINYLRKNESPPSLFIKDLRELEKKTFVREIRQKLKLSYLLDANHFSGKMHKKEVKLRGGTYIVVSSKTDFVVLSVDKHSRKQKGKDVKISETWIQIASATGGFIPNIN